MDRLILLRHGEAEADSASGRDFDRRLTARGARQSAATAERLAALGVAPNLALVSPAARARETWDAAGAILSAAETREDRALYNAEAEDICALLDELEEVPGAVIVVAHNPGLQEVSLGLAAAGGAAHESLVGLRSAFPPAAAAVFRIDSAGRPTFETLVLAE